MEQPKHHEIIGTVRDIVRIIGEKAGKLAFGDVNDLITPPQSDQFQYDSEGNWHNPDGQTVPDVAGRDL